MISETLHFTVDGRRLDAHRNDKNSSQTDQKIAVRPNPLKIYPYFSTWLLKQENGSNYNNMCYLFVLKLSCHRLLFPPINKTVLKNANAVLFSFNFDTFFEQYNWMLQGIYASYWSQTSQMHEACSMRLEGSTPPLSLSISVWAGAPA